MLTGLLILLAGTASMAADFLGPQSCKGCHPEAFALWTQSKHARASAHLKAEDAQNARCMTCHGPELTTQKVANVTCETCHGGGEHYSPEHVMRDPELARLVGLEDPGEKTCRGCHDDNAPSLTPFDFRKALESIDHWSPAALERIRAAQASAKDAANRAGAPSEATATRGAE
jgi:hypothetical protein